MASLERTAYPTLSKAYSKAELQRDLLVHGSGILAGRHRLGCSKGGSKIHFSAA
jgi:hypothetical protein